jgi:uncharacterized protein YhaN
MRFSRIRIERFGPLADIDTGPAVSLPGLVAVLGPNEAGKTAFHTLLASLVHGFYPATRDQNPYAPWRGGDIGISAEIDLRDGESWEVQRRLLSTPRGELIRGTEVERLDNRSLPCALHVDRRLYSQVYAISLSDMARVEDQAWDSVRDHLIVGMGSDDILPPREVAKSFMSEANRLWRPNRVGSQRLRELQASLSELRKRRADAVESDRTLRRTLNEIDAHEAGLARMNAERRELMRRVGTLRDLLPLRTRLTRVDELERLAGDPAPLRRLPRDPEATLRELQALLRAEESHQASLAAIDDRIRDSFKGLGGSDLTSDDALESLAGRVLDLPVQRLSALLTRLDEERRAVQSAGERIEELERRPRPGPAPFPTWATSLAVAGVLSGVAALVTETPLLWVPAMAALSAGGFVGARKWVERARASAMSEMIESERSDAIARQEAARERMLSTEEEASELLAAVDPAITTDNRPGRVLLREIEKLRDSCEGRVSARRTAGNSGADRVAGDRGDPAASMADFEERLQAAGGGVDPDGLQLVARRLRHLEEFERAKEDLLRDAGDIDALRARIRSIEEERQDLSDSAALLAEQESTLEELDRKIREAEKSVSSLRAEVRHLEQADTPDLVDGQVEDVLSQIRRLERERDRLLLMARLVEHAEARFREANQPGLLRRAEGHLARITGGRYSRILSGNAENPHEMHLMADHLPAPAPIEPPLSTGTREQVYLALRLAIVDHLDADQEPLPLLLDELLVNWDPRRTEQGIGLLREISEMRQVFLFTCQPGLAEAVARAGGHTIELDGPTAGGE